MYIFIIIYTYFVTNIVITIFYENYERRSRLSNSVFGKKCLDFTPRNTVTCNAELER